MTGLERVGFVLVNGAIFGSLLALTAVGLSLIFGVLGVPNFAQGEFAALAGFVVVGLLGLGVGLLPSVLVALSATFAVGVAVERLVISKFYGRENFLLLSFFATFGLTIVAEDVFRKLFGGFHQLPAPDIGAVVLFGSQIELLRIATGAMAVLTLVGLYLFTRYTYAGLAMRAVADDPEGAQLLGVDTERISTLTFGVGAVLTGASGVLYGMVFTIYPTVGVSLTAFAFTIVVVGGVGSFGGVIAASLLVGVVNAATATFASSQWRFFAVFAVLFVVLTVKPGGLRGEFDVEH